MNSYMDIKKNEVGLYIWVWKNIWDSLLSDESETVWRIDSIFVFFFKQCIVKGLEGYGPNH